VTLLALTVGAAGAVSDLIARGDSAWARRAEGASALRAAPEPIAKAIAGYEAALEADPGDPEASWKLMRALYYQGRYVHTDRDSKSETFGRGRDVGEAAIARLAEQAGSTGDLLTGDHQEMEVEQIVELLRAQPHAAPIFFWTGAHWGLWGESTGKMAAARQGVAGKIRDYSQVVIGLDEMYESAGAYRVLGRLHFEAPRIPFITGWIDRHEAVRALERAVELVPEHPLSQLYLVEALYEHERSRRGEAVERLERLIARGPRSDHPVEDGRTLETARILLAEWTE
jgi:tetratricopeptide (TPR) repeat protein